MSKKDEYFRHRERQRVNAELKLLEAETRGITMAPQDAMLRVVEIRARVAELKKKKRLLVKQKPESLRSRCARVLTDTPQGIDAIAESLGEPKKRVRDTIKQMTYIGLAQSIKNDWRVQYRKPSLIWKALKLLSEEPQSASLVAARMHVSYAVAYKALEYAVDAGKCERSDEGARYMLPPKPLEETYGLEDDDC